MPAILRPGRPDRRMLANNLDAGYGPGQDLSQAQSLPILFAQQLHDAVPHSDLQAGQAKPLLRQRALDGCLDVLVSPGNHPDEVVAADDSDHALAPHHREALDVRLQHSLRNEAQVDVLFDRVHLGHHHLIHPARQGLGPWRKWHRLRSGIRRGLKLQQVGFGHGPDQPAVRIHYGERADPVPHQEPGCVLAVPVGRHRDGG